MPKPPRRVFDHVLILMFENQYRSYVLQNAYMRRLARQGIELANSFGVMHPSQTNYIASIAGELCNVTSDEPPAELLPQRTIVDLLEEAPEALGWKAYMESYVPQSTPWTPQLTPADAPPYYRKHNPFASFAGIVRDQKRWSRIQSESALFTDILSGTLPAYAWFTPNIWNDGHYLDGQYVESKPRAPALVDQAAAWLEGFFGALRFPGPRSHLPPRTLVVVTFDEADYEAAWAAGSVSPYDGPNQIYTVLLGDFIEPGVEEEGYNHYSLLRTIEENFDLGSLGKNDAGANWFQFLWGRRFQWSAPESTPIVEAGSLAAAGFAGALHVVYTGEGGRIKYRTRSRSGWSAEQSIDAATTDSGGLALAATERELVLVYRGERGGLYALRYDLQSGWSASQEISSAPAAAMALAAFDERQRIMLAWQGEDGAVHSNVYAGGEWAADVPVTGFKTDGGLTLCALGHALYLIYKDAEGMGIQVVSYNSAPFNVVTVPTNKYGGAQDNTTRGAWSPSAFPVTYFSERADATTPGELEPYALPYQTRGPLAAAELDGVLHLVHPGISNSLLLTESLSIAGVMTPARPVSYLTQDTADHNDGFGTLAEAGWSREAAIFGALCPPGGSIAMGRAAGEIALLFQPEPGGRVELCLGRYEGG
jgi:hypothetical protein